jgi:NAD(P)-dependent dehydrogenase (short-subunit alcohol dehydrogenase family)
VVLYSVAPGVAGRDLPQLAAAKGALEALAESLAAALPAASVLVARAPRMRTDQVNTPSARLRAVAPGVVATEVVDRLEAREPGLDVWEVGRFLSPGESNLPRTTEEAATR